MPGVQLSANLSDAQDSADAVVPVTITPGEPVATPWLGAFKSDEAGRILALERLRIVGSQKESPFENIVDLVCQVLNVPICAVSLIDVDRQWFKTSRGLNVCQTNREIAFCGHAIKRITPFVIPDATRNSIFANNPLVTGPPHIRSYAGMPLTTAEGYNIGTLCAIDVVAREFSDRELGILETFAKIVTGQIELRQIASTDPLTGLLSRRAWLDCAEREMRRSLQDRSALSLMVLDIDHFKTINDNFGHPSGDLVLKDIAQCAARQLQKSDWFGRYGGEEFFVALPDTPLAEAEAIAERMRSAIEALRMVAIGGQRCTVSIGVTTVNVNDATVRCAIERADRALYQAKSSGRNQVTVVAPADRLPTSRAA